VVVGWLVHEGKITTPEVVLFCCLIPSIILHEIAHGWVALAFGDDTAKRAGRLSLNPLRHIDPVGTLLVPALMSLSGYGFFGWAKPVPVNVGRLRSPRNQGVLVSLAGPGTNAVLAGLAAAAFFAVGGVGSFAQAFTLRGNVSHVNVAYVLYYLGLVNLGLGAFNLIPIPPLDGSVLVERLLPRAWWPGYLRIRPFTMPILLVLVVINLQLGTHGPITWLFDQLNAWWNHVLLGI
jgi:Zn-dependent protease